MPFDLSDNPLSAVLAKKTYSQFKEALKAFDCRLCGLCEARTQIVLDRGNPNAKIMVIGEAPGQNEDLQGQAFVGRGGKLFDQVMSNIGLDSNRDLFICNVVKCRPPKNRKPLDVEVKACHPFLQKQ